MTFYKHNPFWKSFLIYYLFGLANAAVLQHELEEKRPRIFKIIERKNRIFLEKGDDERYDSAYLKRFLRENADLEYRLNNILHKEDILSKHHKGLKKRFIKRIVPHGRDTSDLQYDYKKHMYFKPLVRLHKTRLAKQKGSDDGIKQRANGPQQIIGNVIALNAIRNLLKNKLMDKLDGITNKPAAKVDRKFPNKPVNLQDFKPVFKEQLLGPEGLLGPAVEYGHRPSEAQHAIMHLYDIDKLIDKVKTVHLRTQLHKKLQQIIADVEKLHKDASTILAREKLRGGAPAVETLDTTEETTDPAAVTVLPGINMTINLMPPEQEVASEKPCALYPHQPLWNYWTYKNKIHIDDCPKDLVKIGNFCVKQVPHKKK